MSRAASTLIVLMFAALCGGVLYLKFRAPVEPPAAIPRTGEATAHAPEPKDGARKLEVLFSSSDGKKGWVDGVVKEFNAKNVEVNGQTVVVKAKHMRSGESRQAVLAGKEKPTLWSPAGRSWIELMNKDWQIREKKPFVENVHDTVVTALIIATWEPMARALGWPEKPIGWADLQKVATDPKGWAAFGHPEWGEFRFGHSHPDYSNSAMLSVLSLIYAASGKTAGLTSEDMKNPKVVAAVKAIEHAIVHYGESSSWLTEKLCTRGPSYLSAVTIYESSVVKANDKFPKKPFPLVAIYPREGTFWETHPAGIVNADWVTADQREGAKRFLDFLLSREQQAKAPEFGFRPALKDVPLAEPFGKSHGVDPDAERKELEYVDEDLFQRANSVWHDVKKKATIWVLLDTSKSMDGEPMEAAKRGCVRFVKHMDPDDIVHVLSFNSRLAPLGVPGRVREVGEGLVAKISGLYADGNTSLNDALVAALDEVQKARESEKEKRLYGIVVLSDGQDTTSRSKKPDVLEKLPKGEDTEGTRVFSIAYGDAADVSFLQEISERSNAVMLKGGSADVEKLYHQLASYF
jgi:Ca-activated chloride channel family protein